MSTPQIPHQIFPTGLSFETPERDAEVLVESPTASVIEGAVVRIDIRRTGNTLAPCSVDFAVSAPAGTYTGLTTGTASFLPGQTEYSFTINTVDRAGLQGERSITITLSNPVGCILAPGRSVFEVVVLDRIMPISGWWNLPNRSGRSLASGVANLGGTLTGSPINAFETGVSLADSVAGFSSGTNNAYVQTWDQVIGTPPSGGGNSQPRPYSFPGNVFNMWSAHHRPIGDGATYGIPPGALRDNVRSNSLNASHYAGGVLGRRGRFSLVRGFSLSSEPKNRKYIHNINASWSVREVVHHERGGTGDNLPFSLKVPTPTQAPLPPHWPEILDPGPGVDPNKSNIGDNEVILHDPMTSTAHAFAEFMYVTNKPSIRALVPAVSAARARRFYLLNGRDVRRNWNTPGGEWGPGAIDWRHPAAFLRGDEVDLTGNTPIRHVLNFTVCRHSNKGAPAAWHLISFRLAYPAWNTDLPQQAGDNTGDLPYGTNICIRKGDAGARDSTTANPFTSPYIDNVNDRTPAGPRHSYNSAGAAVYTLNLSPFEKQLFDTMLHYGGIICDGQGQVNNGGPEVNVRVDHVLGANSAKVTATLNAFNKLIPLMWPIHNPRKHYEADDGPSGVETHSDGMPYFGGGGPIGPKSINDAFDAPPSSGDPDAHQLNWTAGVTSFGTMFNYVPVGGSFATDGSAWLVWFFHMFPVSERTDTGDSSVLDEIAAGTHDAKYQLLGSRIAAKFSARGIPLKRFVGAPCPGMNASGPYQIFASTRLKYKAAAERMAAQMRIGAAFPDLRFAHIVAKSPEIGALTDWFPSNFDAIGMIVTPDANVTAE